MSRTQQVLNFIKHPLLAAGRSYNSTAQKYPFATGVVTTVVKTSAADMFAQKVIEQREWKDFDWKRHSVFCSFGLFYLGGFQYYLYNNLFVKWCASITQAFGHAASAPIKTFIDQAIHHPFCYFPCFYLMKGVAEERPLASTFHKYQTELWENCKALWMIWVPAQMVNFTVVPRHLRIPFVAFVSLAWTVIISVMRGALEQDAVAAVAAPTPQELNQQHAAVAASAAVAATAVAAAGGSGGGATGHAMHASAASLSDVMEGGVGLKGLVATPSVAEAQT